MSVGTVWKFKNFKQILSAFGTWLVYGNWYNKGRAKKFLKVKKGWWGDMGAMLALVIGMVLGFVMGFIALAMFDGMR